MIRVNGQPLENYARQTHSSPRRQAAAKTAQQWRTKRPPFEPPKKPKKAFWFSEMGESF